MKNNFISKKIMEGITKELIKECKTINGYKKENKRYYKNFKEFLGKHTKEIYNFNKKIIKNKIDNINYYISSYYKKQIEKNINDIEKLKKYAYQNNYKEFNTNISKNMYSTFISGYEIENNIKDFFMYNLYVNCKTYKNLKSKKLKYNKLHKIYIKKIIKEYKKRIKENRIKNIQKTFSYKIGDKRKTIYNNNIYKYYTEFAETLLNDIMLLLLENKKMVFYNTKKMVLPKKVLYLIYCKIENTLKYYNNAIDKEKQVVNDIDKNYIYVKALFLNNISKKSIKSYDFINNIDFTEKQKIIVDFLRLNLSKVDIANNLNISKQLLNKHINIIKNKINKYIKANNISIA